MKQGCRTVLNFISMAHNSGKKEPIICRVFFPMSDLMNIILQTYCYTVYKEDAQ